VHADEKKNLRIIGRHEHHREAVAGGVPGVRACGCPGFGEDIARGERSMHLRTGSVPGGESHPVQNLAHAGLLVLANQFEVSVSQARG
jgi:hypothetical protein